MPRINPIDPDQADPKAAAMLQGVHKALGITPNLMKTLAHSPAALGAYLGLGQALSGGTLGGRLREQIALTVSGLNGCEYCSGAHTVLGRKLGLDDDELARNLRGESSDPRTAAALHFVRRVLLTRGFVSDGEIAVVRAVGFGDGDIAEIVAVIAHNVLSNFFNHVAQTEADFPKVDLPERAAA